MKTVTTRPMNNVLPSLFVCAGLFTCALLTAPYSGLADGLQGGKVGSNTNMKGLGRPSSSEARDGTADPAQRKQGKPFLRKEDPILNELNNLKQETTQNESHQQSDSEKSDADLRNDTFEPNWDDEGFEPSISGEFSLEEVKKYINAPKVYDKPFRPAGDDGVTPYEEAHAIPLWVDGRYVEPFEGGYFAQFSHRGIEKGEAQGLKIHISAAPNEERATIDLITEFLQKNLVEHKVATAKGYEKFVGGTQQGKLITVYPKDEAHAKELAEKLNRLVAENDLQRADDIQGEARVGPNAFVRYGAKKSQRGVPDGSIKTPTGEIEKDLRGEASWPTWYTPPPWLSDLVDENVSE